MQASSLSSRNVSLHVLGREQRTEIQDLQGMILNSWRGNDNFEQNDTVGIVVPIFERAEVEFYSEPSHTKEWRMTMDLLGNWKRTDYCGDLRRKDVDREVTLLGWVQRRRDLGGLIFVELRDRQGIVQAVFNPELNREAHEKAQFLRSEFVVGVRGKVVTRPEGTSNPKLKTGEIEVIAQELKILNPSKNPPFLIEDDEEVAENVRLQYRYLDLRRPRLQQNLILRHRVAKEVRNYFDSLGFLEVETPMLTKSPPEGARDYLVPSRVQPGQFFALPQSPQLFKQLLMMGGLDRYYQLCRCFRDEDLRADRQPEVPQIDVERAFLREADIYRVVEGLMVALFKELKGVELATPFPRLTYQECMDRFGLDRPDTRFGLELQDGTALGG